MTTERSPKMGKKYTQQDHLEYRRKVDEQARKEEEANRERFEKEGARQQARATTARKAS
jgi:hypothetical protein